MRSQVGLHLVDALHGCFPPLENDEAKEVEEPPTTQPDEGLRQRVSPSCLLVE